MSRRLRRRATARPQGPRGSDILLIFMLKALRKEKYGDVAHEVDDTAVRVLERIREMANSQRLKALGSGQGEE